MPYNVQNFLYDGPGDSLCFGEQNVHDHNRQVRFTVDVTQYLQNQGCVNIRPGAFLGNQPRPAAGKEFRWNANSNSWVRV